VEGCHSAVSVLGDTDSRGQGNHRLEVVALGDRQDGIRSPMAVLQAPTTTPGIGGVDCAFQTPTDD
jgi:hypothetical protein